MNVRLRMYEYCNSDLGTIYAKVLYVGTTFIFINFWNQSHKRSMKKESTYSHCKKRITLSLIIILEKAIWHKYALRNVNTIC